jgi:hypothetical protein
MPVNSGVSTQERYGLNFLATIAFALLPFSVAHSQQLVACDLVEPAAAAVILGSELTRHTPNRATQKLADGSAVSDCLFYARKDRDSLRVRLIEYPSAKEAEKAFSEGASSTDLVKHTQAPGLGDAATSWSMGTEAYGFNIRKGRRILVLDTRWRDANTGAGLKDRLSPVATGAIRKL